MAAASWDSRRSSKTTQHQQQPHAHHHHLLPAPPRPLPCGRRPPRPPPFVRRSVAAWEKDFCESRGEPWEKAMDQGAGLNADPDGRVERWDDSGAFEALMAARKRYWAEINGGLAAPPLPDPDMYNDKVDDDESGAVVLDPELVAEYEEALLEMERAWEENESAGSRVLTAADLPEDFVPVATGWDDV